MIEGLRQRMDNWRNLATGVGTSADKRMLTDVSRMVKGKMEEADAEALYEGDKIAEKMVDMLPNDMIRQGFKVNSAELTETEHLALQKHIEEKLNWKRRFRQGLSWGRLYGGAALFLGVDDGRKIDEPLNWEGVRKLGFTTVFSRWELEAVKESVEQDPEKPTFGSPEFYLLKKFSKDGKVRAIIETQKIHASRLLTFYGAPLPRKRFAENGYWADSILAKRKDALRDYATGFGSTAALMSDVSQAVFTVKNLHEILAMADGMKLLKDRLALLEASRSVVNAMLIDGEETFERKTTSLAGIPEILRKLEERVVASGEYPHNLILGEAPGSGLGETGKAEMRQYYDTVSQRQETDLKPALRTFLRAVFLDKNGPTKGKEPSEWDIEFNPLWQDTLSEILEQRERQARIDQVYISTQVVSPDEIAKSRFASGRYSFETVLDFDRDESTSIDDTDEEEEITAGGSNAADDDDDMGDLRR